MHRAPAPPDATGDRAADTGLLMLFQRYRADLLRFLTARCGSADLAQDLAQDLWLRLERAHSGPVANGRAYLFQAAHRLVLDHRRAALRRALRDGEWQASGEQGALAPDQRIAPEPAADDMLIAAQEAALLRRVIDALPPGARQALCLHRLEGLSHAEVAERMGISRSGVEKHMAVAMKHLRASLLVAGWGDGAGAASGSAEAPDGPTPPARAR